MFPVLLLYHVVLNKDVIDGVEAYYFVGGVWNLGHAVMPSRVTDAYALAMPQSGRLSWLNTWVSCLQTGVAGILQT